MNDVLSQLQAISDSFDKSYKGLSLDLRTQLAALIALSLKQQGITQAQLAKRAEITEPMVSRLVHSEANFTVDTAAKVLHALGIAAFLQERGHSVNSYRPAFCYQSAHNDIQEFVVDWTASEESITPSIKVDRKNFIEEHHHGEKSGQAKIQRDNPKFIKTAAAGRTLQVA